MARGVNKVILVGNLGADPDVKKFPDGGAIANVSVATTDMWKDRQTGEQKEHTEWHRVVFRGGLAGVVEQYLRKGSQVYVEGSIRRRKWQDKEGNDQFITEIIALNMNMLGGRSGGGGGEYDQSPPPASAPSGGGKKSGAADKAADDFDDDIPF